MSGVAGVSAVCEAPCCSGSWLSSDALGDDWVTNASAITRSGQVAKSSSGKSESPCSSEVLTRMKRTKETSPEPMERFALRSSVRSDARPKRNQSKHSRGASW
ncbi:hypothetical protein PHYSODRAFT_491687 [Phytophthora sojae]|uniref:Uncharacterized protein n=1 Tax=Phytophthora sojae (strain P6497) TaxID=1094619 RepID=G4ZBT4_PHYSP|nr:hypothetical protein PHYSODRAFT_491687 [Phytophthora sojae]EGZ21288.1 hypothetical protein PHYSODRAFT_491687 [Phytophthora sojae]|eukprot:XP_009524005.1 hypothetical protein PHYSODRAFT_491687 [Phytophthora sojae]